MKISIVFKMFPRAFRRLIGAVLIAGGMSYSAGAGAQVLLDRVDSERTPNGDREIVLWFLRDVVYLRSSPRSEGQTVRIYLQILPPPESAAIRETLSGGAQEASPGFSVTFPELDGSVSVAFQKPVSFRVAQLRGTRSVSIIVAANKAGSHFGFPRFRFATQGTTGNPVAVAVWPAVPLQLAETAPPKLASEELRETVN